MPYGILGAVLIDFDVAFRLLSDNYPGLYMFTHGGITHSISGAVAVSVIGLVAAVIISALLPVNNSWRMSLTGIGLLAVLCGAMSHLVFDYLAYPGIPLFYPFTDLKYTAGIFAGPSIAISITSAVFIGLLYFRKAGNEHLILYLGAVLLFVVLFAGIKLYAGSISDGRTIPTMNPAYWIIVDESDTAYRITCLDLISGSSEAEEFRKYTNIIQPELLSIDITPELKRLKYHSYAVTVEKYGEYIIFKDPLRENGYLWYPPYFKTLAIKKHDSL